MNTNNIYSKDWCNQLFEGKTKSYGAYELRINAAKRTTYGMIIAYALAASFVIGSMVYEKFNVNSQVVQKELFETTLVDLTELFVPPPPTPEPQLNTAPAAPKAPSNQMVNPIVVTDKKVIDDTDDGKLPDDLKDDNTGKIGANTGDTKLPVTGGGGNTNINVDTTSNVPMRVAEEMPEFPGGIEALTKYLSSHVKYPRQYLEMNVNGTVYLSFVINKKGKVTDISVLKGLHESDAFEIEAMKAVSSMPDWKPGKQSNKEVSVMYTLPVAFRTR
ncbi:MAG TPA: TonB family protein [Bacteroidia bacterium]|nr:TonB family protein [Bacteroidota bacterium]HRC32269.1 TonB family protein [Bacteroidia bacterium]